MIIGGAFGGYFVLLGKLICRVSPFFLGIFAPICYRNMCFFSNTWLIMKDSISVRNHIPIFNFGKDSPFQGLICHNTSIHWKESNSSRLNTKCIDTAEYLRYVSPSVWKTIPVTFVYCIVTKSKWYRDNPPAEMHIYTDRDVIFT